MTDHTWIFLPQLPEDGHFVWLCPKGRPVMEAWFLDAKLNPEAGKKESVFVIGHNEMLKLDEIECWMPYFTPEPPHA